MNVFKHFFPFSLLIVSTVSWNIETRLPVTFWKSKNSYFGFSVALHDNSNGSFALVTATRANSSIDGRKKLHQPGALYKCDIITTECDEVVFEKKAEVTGYGKINGPSLSKEDNMWLGISLDVQPIKKGNIVTCAHLWNQIYFSNYYPKGACYVIDRNFNRSSYQALVPFARYMEKFNFGQAGISAAFSENGDLVLGAPGYEYWKGAVYRYSLPYNLHSDPLIMEPNKARGWRINNYYIGYSVSTGKFLESKHQFVAGAPRDGDYKGRVYIFESEIQRITVRQILEGEKVGEYFGASVLGIDINNDSHTDLLVGSPFYSLPSGGDEGKVYVYMSKGMGLQKVEELMGSKETESRFGTSIANAGDLNQDGYIDVAIGAPYEDDHGVVYIYHGNGDGITPKYVQRIPAKKINPSLSGFGISISRGKDIDNNYYPDLLIGSYLSDHAVLFKTRPIVRVYGNITFDPQQINANTSICSFENKLVPCFNVSYCLYYIGNHVPDQLNISINLTSARKREVLQIRRYFMFQKKLSSYIRANVTVKKRYGNCFLHHAYVASDPYDFITPIQITLNFELAHDVNNENVFCKSCPILHPKSSSNITRAITFQTDCGEDNTCISDLRLMADISSKEVIVGEVNVITLAIELKNDKEPAYMAEIKISLPHEIQIINQGNCLSEQSNYQTIICQAGNPLRAGYIAKYDITFDTSHVSGEFDHITINVTAITASEEENVDDNQKVKIDISLKVLTDITIIGYPDVEQIVLGKDQSDIAPAKFVHVYNVLKILPSPISFVSVEILIPTDFSGSNITFLQLENIGINEGSSTQVPATCDFSQVDLQPESAEFEERKEVLPTPRPKRNTINKGNMLDNIQNSTDNDQGSTTDNILKCSNSICTKIRCTAGPFTQRTTSATFRIYGGFVNIHSLRKVLGQWDRITLMTEGRVKIKNPRENVQPKNHRPDEANVTTTLVQMIPLPAKRIALWIVGVSIAAGILLLVLIMLGLIKLGFFRRQKKENMKKLMMNAELEESAPHAYPNEEMERENEIYESVMEQR